MTDAGTTTTYTYDGEGNRLAASTIGTATKYLWDSSGGISQLAIERDGTNSLIRRYVYGLRRISMTTPGGTFFYHYDALGSVTNLTAADGTSERTYDYEPFGASRTSTQDDPNAPANPIQFAGEYADSIGLYNLHAREYDVAAGRFLQPDPAQGATTLPRTGSYAYAGDRPTVMVDPSGMTFHPAFDGISAVAGVLSPSNSDRSWNSYKPIRGLRTNPSFKPGSVRLQRLPTGYRLLGARFYGGTPMEIDGQTYVSQALGKSFVWDLSDLALPERAVERLALPPWNSAKKIALVEWEGPIRIPYGIANWQQYFENSPRLEGGHQYAEFPNNLLRAGRVRVTVTLDATPSNILTVNRWLSVDPHTFAPPIGSAEIETARTGRPADDPGGEGGGEGGGG
jgi:RHS repeat-associated protein